MYRDYEGCFNGDLYRESVSLDIRRDSRLLDEEWLLRDARVLVEYHRDDCFYWEVSARAMLPLNAILV